MSRSKSTSTAEKHHYLPSDIVYSSGWCTADFRSADKQREIDRGSNKTQNADNLGQLLQLIDDEQICSFHVFMKTVYTHFPNMRECAIQNHSLLRDVIRDKKYDVACGFVDMSYKDVCKELKTERATVANYQEKIDRLVDLNLKLTAERDYNYERFLELQTFLEDEKRYSQHLLKANKVLQEMLSYEGIDID